jgi:hypothetical protein
MGNILTGKGTDDLPRTLHYVGYFVRSDFIPRRPLRCGRGYQHIASEVTQTVACGARFESQPSQGLAQLISCMAFISHIQENSSHDSLLSRHSLPRQSVPCELVGPSLIKLRVETRVDAERAQIEHRAKNDLYLY